MLEFNEKQGFICDMDGVIYHGNQILPGVAEFIRWLQEEGKEYLFLTNNSGYTPRELHQKLLSDYRLQMEMVSGFYVLGMTSLLDDDEGFYRLNQALHEIDQKLQSLNASEPCCYPQNIEEKTPEITKLKNISFKTALGIGLFQVLSLIPGTSRSGSTIIGGMLLGTSRELAAEFTFFLGIPVMAGASLLKLLKFGFAFESGEIGLLLVGMVVSFVVSILAIRFLMGYIKKHDFKVFGWYRIVLGVLVIIYFFIKSVVAA